MDKRFLQSLGIEIGLKRWEAYLLFLLASAIGAVTTWIGLVILIGLFG